MVSQSPTTHPAPTPAPAIGPPRVAVRAAGPADRSAVEAMVERCTAETLRRRFNGAVGRAARREISRITDPTERHRSWIAVDPSGAVHGTATLALAASGVAEAAVLVEDGWRRRGIGRALVSALTDDARRSGLGAVVAAVHADNVPAVHFVRALSPRARAEHHGGGDLEVTVALRAGARGRTPAGVATAPPAREVA
ncbi:MAG TPA: GNAT family N-acetyltransferase [Acidimicrobiales bacterium]